MHYEARMERIHRYNPRRCWGEFGYALGGRDWVSLTMRLQTKIEQHWRRSGKWSIWMRSMGGMPGAQNQFNRLLTRNSGNVMTGLYHWSCYGELAGGSRSVASYAASWSYIQGSTKNRENEGTTKILRCMLYLVYAELGVFCTPCQLIMMAWRDGEGWLDFVFLRWW